MKLCIPKYYDEFKCIADKCKDCCCIGWEIDINSEKAEFYKNYPGPWGEKLRNNISFGETNHFILDNSERCPFLNDKNLCEIIINLGENAIGNICTEHPRYYEWFEDIKEGGIGICCEEACRIILSQTEPFFTIEKEIPIEECNSYDKDLYNYLHNVRSKIIKYLDNDFLPFNARIRNIIKFTYNIQSHIENNDYSEINISNIVNSNTSKTNKNIILGILNYYLELEVLDTSWPNLLNNLINITKTDYYKINDFEQANPEINNYLKNLAIYFIWRYFLKGVFDRDVISKIILMTSSIYIIKLLYFAKWLENNVLTFEDCINLAKMYSKEIEYSENNVFEIENAYYNSIFFSIDNLIDLF